MNKFEIHQIFYDEKSRAILDSGFIPLDNTENSRPDWGEFWVIRNFLNSRELEEDKFYGFFSPKFHQKTGLQSSQVNDFINATSPETDVVLFSPFWEYICFFLNPFEQGEYTHAGLLSISREFLNSTNRFSEVQSLVMHSGNSVFSNYFLAKPAFWRSWLSIGNDLFHCAEKIDHPLYARLNSNTIHGPNYYYSLKIFLQERLASYLLATEKWNTENYSIFSMPWKINDHSIFRNELIACDALKQQFCKNRDNVYIDEYFRLKKEIARRINILIN